jgi:hypothetical protein
METLKIHYCDFWPEWPQENFIEPIIRKHYNIVIDQQNPDVLFHSVFGGGREAAAYKCKKIQFIGENRRPMVTDYSISFDPHSPTNFRLPLWQAFILKKPEYKERLFNGSQLNEDEFVRFAAFIVSNGSNFIRNGAFHQLSEYKKVHSYGRFMNNDQILINYSQGKYWRDAKDAFFQKNPHKFMMTYENNSYPGYCTEKLMDGFLAGSVPIYWGDPWVKKDWNEKAFINVMNIPDWISEIKRLDNDFSAFKGMYEEPVFTREQKFRHSETLLGFEDWLIEKIKR